jgi:TraX protein
MFRLKQWWRSWSSTKAGYSVLSRVPNLVHDQCSAQLHGAVELINCGSRWPMFSNYQIKLLAALLMLVDHVGVVFFPGMSLFRVVGRFSFPLFILLLVDGERYSRNFGQYCLRLFLFGIISQPIVELLFPSDSWNILFILLLGLLCLRLVRVFSRWRLLIWLGAAIVAQGLNLEYGAYGITAIALIQNWQPTVLWWSGWIALHLGLLIMMPDFATLQFPAIVAPVLLNLANHQPGPRARWFYSFYPLHWLALWMLYYLLSLGV